MKATSPFPAIFAILPLALAASWPVAGASPPPLVRVATAGVDEAWVRPGASLGAYRKVFVAPPQVAFAPGWLRGVNDRRLGLSDRVGPAQAEQVRQAAAEDLRDGLAAAFRARGYEVVAAPGPGVLAIAPHLEDLYVNAADAMAPGTLRTYVYEAGTAKLVIEASDAGDGTLLARLADRRSTLRHAMPQLATTAQSRDDFAQLFATWARAAAKDLPRLHSAPGAG